MSEMLAFKKKNKIKQNSLLEEPRDPCSRSKTFWKSHKQLLHYSSPVPKLLSALIKHNKHHKLPGNAHLPSKSISFNGIKSISNANQVDGSIFKRTCPSTYWGSYTTTMGIIQQPWVESLRFQWHSCLLSKTKIKTKFTPWVANRSMLNDRKLSHLVNKNVGQSNP